MKKALNHQSLKISQKTIEEIKSRIDIVDVIGEFVALKKSGSNFKALSPFTNEKTPSFFVSPSKEIYKCFSSGKGGDAINFIMELEGLSYVEALRYLAKKYGITIEEEHSLPEDIQQQNERESLFIVLNFAREYFTNLLWENPDGKAIGLSYFLERGFSENIIRRFELGYSIDEWDGLLRTARTAGFSEEILEKAGLVVRNNERVYDRFRGRVIFPVHNISGKVIAFGARILTHDKNQPKYVNSPETPVYHKSSILYGMHQARQAIRKEDNCYLVEGYTDVISMHISGVENVVASSGTSLTSEQIALIKRYTENITVLFDGDQAGIKASLRGIDMILESGMNVRALVFPDSEDPDSFARKLGYSEFRKFLRDNRKDFISFKASLFALESASDPIRRAESIREIVSSISKIPDPVKRAIYIRESSGILAMDEKVLIEELNKFLLAERKKIRKDPGRIEEIKVTPPSRKEATEISDVIDEGIRLQEKESIRLLICYGLNKIEEEHKLYEFMLKELSDIEFHTPVYRKILSIFKENLAGGHVIDADYLINHGTEEVRKEVIDLVTSRFDISENWSKRQINVPVERDFLGKSVLENVVRLKHRIILKLIEDNNKEIRKSADDKKTEQLLKIGIELNQFKADLARQLGITVI
ncbi:MAG TPA: DNA primase [Cyclobacteriaceae bacterium]|nr:DNA primase [Cyclobacteriaceae bacterium]